MRIEFEVCDRCGVELKDAKKRVKPRTRIEIKPPKEKWRKIALCARCERRFLEWLDSGFRERMGDLSMPEAPDEFGYFDGE